MDLKANARKYVHDLVDCANVYLEYSEVVEQYAYGTDQAVQEMSRTVLDDILQLVIITDHYGNFGGKNIPEEALPEHVSPLLMGSAMQKRYFLLDLCERVCTGQQKAMQAAIILEDNLRQPHQHMRISSSSNSSSCSISGHPQQKRNNSSRNPSFSPPVEMENLSVNPSSSLSKEVEPAVDPLILANHYVDRYVICQPDTQNYFYREHSKVAIDFALGNDQNAQEMTAKHLEAILRLVVFTDHYGMRGGRNISKDNLPEYVSPLVQGNAGQKRAFLLDLCERVCTEELQEAKASQKKN